MFRLDMKGEGVSKSVLFWTAGASMSFFAMAGVDMMPQILPRSKFSAALVTTVAVCRISHLLPFPSSSDDREAIPGASFEKYDVNVGAGAG